MSFFANNPVLGDHLNKMRSLPVRIAVDGNATPASAIVTCSLSGIAIVRKEGIVAAADAVEAVTWTTAVDATNAIFGVILKGSELDEGGAGIDKVIGVSVFDLAGTATSIAVRGPNNTALSACLTAGGNIAVEIVGTGLDMDASEDAEVGLIIHYLLK